MYGIIYGDTKSNGENNRGTGLDFYTHITHNGCDKNKRYCIGDNTYDNHSNRAEDKAHYQRDNTYGNQ